VTELRAGRSGIESRWGRDFSPFQTGPGAHLASCTMGTGSFPGVKCGRDVLLTTHPFSSVAVMEEYSYTSTQPLGHNRACNGITLPYITYQTKCTNISIYKVMFKTLCLQHVSMSYGSSSWRKHINQICINKNKETIRLAIYDYNHIFKFIV